MRPSFKRPSVIIPRPTKTSLARQTKIRNSISISTSTTTLKPIQNDLSNAKKTVVFKRRRSFHKLTVENSTGDGETLKQIIVASLTENVKKMDLVEQTKTNENKENRAAKRTTTNVSRKKAAVEIFANENFHIEIVEPALNDELSSTDDDGELIDPTYAMDYIVDIMNLLYALEKKYSFESNFLTHSASSTSNSLTSMATLANGSATRPWKLTTKHRTILVGWIIQLFYARFHLSQDALHICVGLLDRFLQQSIQNSTAAASFVTQKNLQLIAVAAFLIAAKLEETHHPPVDELVYVTDHTYTSDQVKRMEKKILHELRFELNRPTSLQFLRRYSFISNAGDDQHAIGKFLIDMALIDVATLNFAPSLIAASATFIARFLLLHSHQNAPTFEQIWTEDLRMRSPYKTKDSLMFAVKILAEFIRKYVNGKQPKECDLLIQRYEHEQLSQASLYCVQHAALIHQLVNENI